VTKDELLRALSAAEQRSQYLAEEVVAQHEETGREWRGQRRLLPPRYVETAKEPTHG
jgi:hypothetical protein